MKINIIVVLLLLLNFQAVAQFSLDGELRPRTEYRHGYGSIIPDGVEPGYGISTRARLNFGYSKSSYSFYIALQDVLVWGENRQLAPKDLNNSFAIFQAWANLNVGENFDIKLGRQIISYDDQRILGAVDWAQQGRNHDAILLKYKKEKFLLDFGFAFNQDYDEIGGFQSEGNTYYTTGFFSYKTMLYGHLQKSWEAFSFSLLALNNGFQNFTEDGTEADGISNLQTFGTHLKYSKGIFGASANIYGQTGERQNEIKVKGAYLLGLDLNFNISETTGLGIGAEIISGNDQNAGSTGAFFPLYGTNHKFNGYMDYFYVGNHANSIGLVDFHISADFNISEKSGFLVKVLSFSGEQSLPSGDKFLGTEVDLVYILKLKEFTFKAGYSQMFASDGMYELKGVPESLASNVQNWAWAMLVFKPKFM